MSSHRFSFDGFHFVESADTDTHEIECGHIAAGGKTFLVDLIRNKSVADRARFLVASISLGDKKIWTFKDENFAGFGFLAMAGDEIVVALVGRLTKAVERVIPLADLAGDATRGVVSFIKLKRDAAHYLDCRYQLTTGEQRVQTIQADRRREELEAERQRQLQEKLQRRIARRTEILGREHITMLASDGQRRYGYPVVGDDWHCLPHGTFVVLCDDKGQPLEAFMVKHRTGRPPAKEASRFAAGSTQVFSDTAILPLLQPVSTKLFEIDQDFYDVPVYADMAAVRTLRERGLNGGTKVAVAGTKDDFTVYAVKHDGIDTIGKFAPLS